VESIALKNPKERTKMFEWISQSRECAAEYEMKKKALLKAKEDTQFHFNKKRSATVERKLVSHEKIEVKPHPATVACSPNPQHQHTFSYFRQIEQMAFIHFPIWRTRCDYETVPCAAVSASRMRGFNFLSENNTKGLNK